MKQVAHLIIITLLLGISAVVYGAQYSLTLENWKNHPDIKAVRKIYVETKARIKSNNYKTEKRKFDIYSPSCSTYQIKSEAIYVDTFNRVRLLKIEQTGSHQEPFTVERYYDSNGTLRFVFVDYLIANVRIYLNSSGEIFWAVEQSNNKFTVFDSSNEDWETQPNSASKAREEFEAQQPCPEITN